MKEEKSLARVSSNGAHFKSSNRLNGRPDHRRRQSLRSVLSPEPAAVVGVSDVFAPLSSGASAISGYQHPPATRLIFALTAHSHRNIDH